MSKQLPEGQTAMSLWDRLRSPWMRDREFSYYNRPHCIWPHLRQTAWEANHVVCGEPVADTLNLPGIRTMTSLLAGGKDIGHFPPSSAIAHLIVLPDLLGALTKGATLAPVCAGHLGKFWGEISEALDTALPEDRERFNQWLKEQPTRKANGEVRRPMKARLNGWQRLWVIMSFVYLLLVVGVTIMFWPTPETTYHRAEFLTMMPAELRDKVEGAYSSSFQRDEARRRRVPSAEELERDFPAKDPKSRKASPPYPTSFVPDPIEFPNGALLDVRSRRGTERHGARRNRVLGGR